MEKTKDSIFLTIPHEVLIDLLWLLPPSLVINFYSVSSAHLKLFDEENGLWEKLTRKIFKWSANVLPSQKPMSVVAVDWKREYRVGAYFDYLTRNCQIRPFATTKENLSKLQTLSNNHFKLNEGTMDFAGGYYITLQSQTKLYPLPIGNFTTAYYEVETMNIDESSLVIGGAIEGFTGYVGSGIMSYGYSQVGGIYLECEMPPNEEQEEWKINAGDIVGFGINFVNKSVFFTKNGKLIHEANKNFDNKPLQELMNLHATVTMGNYELKVNMGSAPFMFDLLKYQQQHAQRPLELYSNVIVDHLLSALDEKKAVLKDNPYFNDSNLPNFDCRLPEILYAVLYGRAPPNSKYFDGSEEQMRPLWMLNAFRMALNSSQRLMSMTTKQTSIAKQMIADLCALFQIQNKNMSWEEQVHTCLNCCVRSLAENFLHLIISCFEEITAIAFEKSLNNAWAVYLLAMVEFMQNRPGEMDHWTKGIMAKFLDPNGGQFNVILPNFINEMMLIKGEIATQSVLAQRCKYLAQVKTKEKEQMMVLFGKSDERLAHGYAKLIDDLVRSSTEDPLNFMDESINRWVNLPVADPIGLIQIEALKVIDKVPNAQPIVIVLYGICRLKISPDDFESAEDYVRYVFQSNKEHIKDKTKYDLLVRLQHLTKETFKDVAILKAKVLLPMKAILGVKIKTDGELEEIVERTRKKIERMLETKNDGPARRKNVTTNNSTNASLIITTVAAIGVIGLGAWWLRKRFAKE